jgi:hypothetical protein
MEIVSGWILPVCLEVEDDVRYGLVLKKTSLRRSPQLAQIAETTIWINTHEQVTSFRAVGGDVFSRRGRRRAVVPRCLKKTYTTIGVYVDCRTE